METSVKKVINKKINLNTKRISKFRPRIRSAHPSHQQFRMSLPLMPFRSVVRFGSTTEVEGTINKGGNIVEINSIDGIKNSSNKRLMKECFTLAGVKTADWYIFKGRDLFRVLSDLSSEKVDLVQLPYPILAKHCMGSRNSGNYKLDNVEQLHNFIQNRANDLGHFIVEKFYNYNREYRLHITEDGCFYTCRKMLKKDTPESERWYKNDSNSVWILEENEQFDKPNNWQEIIDECVKALNSVNLDVCSFDLRVQSSILPNNKQREICDYILIECNSASAMGTVTAIKYNEQLPIILKQKALEYGIIKN